MIIKTISAELDSGELGNMKISGKQNGKGKENGRTLLEHSEITLRFEWKNGIHKSNV